MGLVDDPHCNLRRRRQSRQLRPLSNRIYHWIVYTFYLHMHRNASTNGAIYCERHNSINEVFIYVALIKHSIADIVCHPKAENPFRNPKYSCAKLDVSRFDCTSLRGSFMTYFLHAICHIASGALLGVVDYPAGPPSHTAADKYREDPLLNKFFRCPGCVETGLRQRYGRR